MLMQVHALDPKFISLFLTFPHPLDCLICSEDIIHVHCVITAKDGRMARLGVVGLY